LEETVSDRMPTSHLPRKHEEAANEVGLFAQMVSDAGD
jgi:hypothetical protein